MLQVRLPRNLNLSITDLVQLALAFVFLIGMNWVFTWDHERHAYHKGWIWWFVLILFLSGPILTLWVVLFGGKGLVYDKGRRWFWVKFSFFTATVLSVAFFWLDLFALYPLISSTTLVVILVGGMLLQIRLDRKSENVMRNGDIPRPPQGP